MAKTLCNLTPAELAEQKRFEAAMRGRMSLSYRYMEEDSREYDSPYTAHAWTGWLMAKADASGVMASDDAQRLDYLQRTGSTVELVPNVSVFAPLRFRVGGLHTAVSIDLRTAIDLARADGVGGLDHQTFPPHSPIDGKDR